MVNHVVIMFHNPTLLYCYSVVSFYFYANAASRSVIILCPYINIVLSYYTMDLIILILFFILPYTVLIYYYSTLVVYHHSVTRYLIRRNYHRTAIILLSFDNFNTLIQVLLIP